jgi:3-polyprenyl-4-hydroxybenzoate decarboxylase
VNEGSKGVLLGVGPKIRELPREFRGTPPPDVRDVRVFCAGCLVVQAGAYAEDAGAARRVAGHAAFADWPLVVLVDDAAAATRSAINFLWTTFTRFEPAADVHAARIELVRLHPAFTPPVVIDARHKRGLPEELSCDSLTAAAVARRWSDYFPGGGIAMGDSGRAHLTG